MSNWSTSTFVCIWIGVTCGNSKHRRVIALNLFYMCLTGTIPPYVGNLSFLNSLSDTKNSFHGSLPSELSRLYRLEEMDFGFNSFNGEIPLSLGLLSRLQLLILLGNGFTSSISASFCNISLIIENEQAFAYQQSGRCGGVFSPGLSLDEHTTVIMSRSVVVERHIQLADFYELRFEDRTLPEIVEQAGWLPFLQRTGYASKNLVREFYASILRARDVEEPSMEVTVRNVQIIFSPDELALFLGYVRDVTAFPNVPMTEEGRPTKAEVFWTLLGPDTTILGGKQHASQGSCFLSGGLCT
ncbi:LRR receptor-like serine/threonine-protein kinase EFR [Morella rubra]|uniref:LRR receptor-like serine/threonine-protein kinase EFR n=1 Tax=Morella rubra TaxID=262757 RepID=A0A6A1WQC5_9ROSI|nr:LRR receptor-like serine/threonine-protein kinase EFR [Morella rubra]